MVLISSKKKNIYDDSIIYFKHKVYSLYINIGCDLFYVNMVLL